MDTLHIYNAFTAVLSHFHFSYSRAINAWEEMIEKGWLDDLDPRGKIYKDMRETRERWRREGLI